MIYAVVSLIDKETWRGILNLMPESRQTIARQNETEIIHLSWVVCQQIKEKKLVKDLQNISEHQSVLKISSGGMGIFCGEKPKITLNLARNKKIARLHSKIWNKCQPHMTGIKQYYSPDLWMPHITLIQDGFSKQDYAEFLNKSIYTPFEIEIPITNLAVLFQDDKNAGMLTHFDFKKEP